MSGEERSEGGIGDSEDRPKAKGVERRFRDRLPRWRPARIALGILLVLAGIVGFLPVVGFWMIPLGLAVLAVDVPIVRRWRRRLLVKLEKRARRSYAGRPKKKGRRSAGRK